MSESKLGWYFTEAEEAAIKRAISNSVKFMQNYGKGREPMLIDLSHYENRFPSAFKPKSSPSKSGRR